MPLQLMYHEQPLGAPATRTHCVLLLLPLRARLLCAVGAGKCDRLDIVEEARESTRTTQQDAHHVEARDGRGSPAEPRQKQLADLPSNAVT